MFKKLVLKPFKRLFWLWLILVFLWLALFVSTYVRAADQLVVEDAVRITTYGGRISFFNIATEPSPYGSLAMSYVTAMSVIKDPIFKDGFEDDIERLPLPLWHYQMTLMNMTSQSHSSDCYALVHYQAGIPPTAELDIKLVCPNSTYILPLE